MTRAKDKAGGKPGDKRSTDAGFAGRWSRLKREAKAGPVEAAPETAADAAALDERPDDEVLAELGLPDPDTLKPGDDFSAFLAKAVPVRLRNRALRRLWVSDPVFANLDGLVDYAEDYTDAAKVVEKLQTAYQVGRGFVDRLADAAGGEGAEAEAEQGAAETPETPEISESPEAAATHVPDGPKTGAAEVAGEPTGEGGESAGNNVETVSENAPNVMSGRARIPARKRMKFRVAEE